MTTVECRDKSKILTHVLKVQQKLNVDQIKPSVGTQLDTSAVAYLSIKRQSQSSSLSFMGEQFLCSRLSVSVHINHPSSWQTELTDGVCLCLLTHATTVHACMHMIPNPAHTPKHTQAHAAFM